MYSLILAVYAASGGESDPKRLNAAINTVLTQPDFQKRLAGYGLEPAGGTLAETAAFIRSEDRKWQEIVTRIGVHQR